ncbi:MAG: hypothetical protein Q8O14_15465 [bacterium]|jgi:hypothetical protein|nr:hypothetical protein [bacterium]
MMPLAWPRQLIAGLLLALLSSCARPPLPMAEDPRLAGADPWLAPDLEAASRELPGELLLDLARLRLIEGQVEDPRPLAGGWVLHLRRVLPGAGGQSATGQALLAWLGAGTGRGATRLLLRADSLVVLRQAADRGEALLVLSRHQGEDFPRRRLDVVDAQGRRRLLAEDGADRLHWDGQALLVAEAHAAPAFRERPGSWHLDVRRPLLGSGGDWRLGPAVRLDSPYRALGEFLDAVRRGRWGKARDRADLSRLLALPGGHHGTDLKATLKAAAPELLDKRLLLSAPPRGPISRIEAPGGRPAWRVALEHREDRGWVLTRLERVL